MFVALINTRFLHFVMLFSETHFVNSDIIKSAPVSSFQLPGRKLVGAISAESIYCCMLLFLDHNLYRQAHFVCASRAVVAITL